MKKPGKGYEAPKEALTTGETPPEFGTFTHQAEYGSSKAPGKGTFPSINIDRFRAALESACDLALHHYRTHRDDKSFERDEGELDGLFKGLFALARAAHEKAPWEAEFMDIVREVTEKYREELLRSRKG